MRVRNRLLRQCNVRGIRVIRRVIDGKLCAVRLCNVVHNARRGCDEVKVIFSLQTLLNNLHVQQSQKAAAEAEAERHGGLRLKRQRRVVQLQFFERISKVCIVCTVCRVHTTENHRLHRTVTGQRLCRRSVRQRNGVAHARLAHVFDRCRNVADFARGKALCGLQRRRAQNAAFHHGELTAHRHHADGVAGVHRSLFNTHIRDNAAVCVIVGVENQCAQRHVRVALRCGNIRHDFLHNGFDVEARFRADARRVLCRNTDDVLNLRRNLVRVRGNQIDLVQYRYDLKACVHRKVRVRKRLRLNALRSVHHQHRAFTGRK